MVQMTMTSTYNADEIIRELVSFFTYRKVEDIDTMVSIGKGHYRIGEWLSQKDFDAIKIGLSRFTRDDIFSGKVESYLNDWFKIKIPPDTTVEHTIEVSNYRDMI